MSEVDELDEFSDENQEPIQVKVIQSQKNKPVLVVNGFHYNLNKKVTLHIFCSVFSYFK